MSFEIKIPDDCFYCRFHSINSFYPDHACALYDKFFTLDDSRDIFSDDLEKPDFCKAVLVKVE